MRILLADDDAAMRLLLETLVRQWGYEPLSCADGAAAWATLSGPDAPSLAILDWQMPDLDGIEVVRRARELIHDRDVYLILLTSKAETEDVVEGFGAGADDYLTKPFHPPELRARVRAGFRVLELEQRLRARVQELEAALANVKQLQGLLPICSYCKKIRDDQAYWHNVDSYFAKHAGAQFSHGVCPDCYQKYVQPQVDALKK
ncbi:MAG: response regulator transcription factor [Gemmatimonadetes bacterium]|nr:response regulator transcription factor [Gemmatimonadota bacterium]